MQFKDTLRTLIFSATACLLTFSCITVDKSLGSQYIPDDHELKVYTASFRLPVELKMMDSLQGISTSFTTIGAFQSNEFGVSKFASATNICPTSTTLDLGKDPVIISTYLSMSLATVTSTSTLAATSIIMDPSQEGITQNFNIYRLKKKIDTTTLYINSITEEDYDHTPLNISAATYFGGDSLKVYLNNALGTELLTATPEELDSLDLFMDKFKGLYITCDTPAAGLNGGRLNIFSRSASYLYLRYNFQPTWEEGLERKDTLIALAFGQGYCLNTSTYGSSHLETTEPLDVLPVEGAGGINPYVNIQSLKDTIDNWIAKKGYDPTKVLVAKASIILPFEMPENIDLIPYRYPTYLFPTHRTQVNDATAAKYYYLFDDYGSTSNPLGAMNRSLFNYTCDLSTTIQQIINKEKSELDDTYNFWIYPLMSETDANYGTTTYLIDNNSYFMGKINGPKADRYPELKIVYAVMQ